MKPVVLSRRLRAVADMVTYGNRVCDVGCDHGFTSIYLVQQGISPFVLAMDVREGPLGAARKHIAERGIKSVIETRLSDGLHKYEIGEADTLLCAGMGGRLMMRILAQQKWKTDSFAEMVLQPQSEVERFRTFLYEQGYEIANENMIEEDGKFYPIIRAVKMSAQKKGLTALEARYGPVLLQKRAPALAGCLRREAKVYEEILENLRTQGLNDAGRKARYEKIGQLLAENREALAVVEGESKIK